jgi:hypothetical protein
MHAFEAYTSDGRVAAIADDSTMDDQRRAGSGNLDKRKSVSFSQQLF